MTSDDLSKLISKLSRNPDKRLATLRRIRDIVLSQQEKHQKQQRQNIPHQWNRFHNFFDRESELYREKVASLITAGRAETDDDQAWAKFLCLAAGATSLQALSDTHWRREVIRETDAWLRDNLVVKTHRHSAARETLSILECATPPSQDEAIYCSAKEAATLVDSDTILVVRDQQQFQWGGRPIDGLFKNYLAYWPEHKKIRVTILDLPTPGPLTRRKTIQEVTQKILHGYPSDQRWNILDLKNTADVPHPEFLSPRNCSLLHCFPPCGNHTPAHVDSHGLATFITVQQGELGFGWIAHETPQDRLDIHKDPIPDSVKRKARYMVLRPGQTVYMPSGTIHFIFRRQAIPTMATGGHILTWNSIPKWLSIMKMQELSQEPVDADVTRDSTQAYLNCLKQNLRQDKGNFTSNTLRTVPQQESSTAEKDAVQSDMGVVWSMIKNWDTITQEDLLNKENKFGL
ncbi:lysine-specific demethylase 2b [Fusarium sporotrichioides]|uniref:Lysine-specific demethylase 2b n=1 Tax=Fusarium sporotrichioides TaxID=5514 RepID=A0A395SP03_FUSSP|nr:lysine-specific demethylase 2b [Fusarium sporotrichioides]